MTTFEIVRSPAQIGRIRNRVRLLPELTDLDHSTTDEIVLIVSELTSNAVTAARPESMITVDVVRNADLVHICVENVGPPIGERMHTDLPDSGAVRGRGLAIVSMLTTSMQTAHDDGRTTVSVVYSLVPSDDGPGATGR